MADSKKWLIVVGLLFLVSCSTESDGRWEDTNERECVTVQLVEECKNFSNEYFNDSYPKCVGSFLKCDNPGGYCPPRDNVVCT